MSIRISELKIHSIKTVVAALLSFIRIIPVAAVVFVVVVGDDDKLKNERDICHFHHHRPQIRAFFRRCRRYRKQTPGSDFCMITLAMTCVRVCVCVCASEWTIFRYHFLIFIWALSRTHIFRV